MKMSKPLPRRKFLRNVLTFALTLTTVVLFSVLAVPAGALGAGDTLYVTAGDVALESVTAFFQKSDGTPVDENDVNGTDMEQSDGVFAIVIPEGAYRVYFDAVVGGETDGATGLSYLYEQQVLSEAEGNAFNLVNGEWTTLGSQPSDPIPDNSDSEDTTTADTESAETDRAGYSNQPGNNSATIHPSGTVGGTTITTEVVSVDLSWEAMEFVYTPSSQGEWDMNQHTYVGGTAGGWTSTTNAITVTNHSNVGITASFGFESAAGLELGGEFRDADGQVVESVSLASAENPQGGAGEATTETVKFHITSGSIETDTDDLGAITVKISK